MTVHFPITDGWVLGCMSVLNSKTDIAAYLDVVLFAVVKTTQTYSWNQNINYCALFKHKQ